MTTLAACLAVTDTTLFVLCLAFTPLSTAVGIPWVGYGWDGWHGFVVPHAIVSGGLVVTLVSARSSGAQDTVVSIATLLHPVMVATYEWAMLQWPGGDDGGGMAWLLFIGPLTAASLLIAAGLACKHVQQSTGHRSRRRRTVGAAILAIVAVAFSAVALRPWLDIVVHF